MSVIIDSHCHAWRAWPYDTAVPDPTTRGCAEALMYEMDQNNVSHATVVCARIGGGAGGHGYSNEDNNDYVSHFARTYQDRLSAWVDVDSSWRAEYHRPGAAARLRKELDRADANGFTHYLRANNDGWLRTDHAHEFFQTAAERGAIASIACGADWLDDLTAIALRYPAMPILLHHLGQSPGQDLTQLRNCAQAPNIGIKVSGFNYHATASWDFPYNDSLVLLRDIVDIFGTSRLYWGSDYPASRDALTYRQSLEVVRSHADFLTPRDLDLILGENLAHLLAGHRSAQ